MKHSYLIKIIAGFFLSLLFSFCAIAQSPNKAGAILQEKKLPFLFLENSGQIADQHGRNRPDIDFKISAGGVSVFIGNGHIQYQWRKLVRVDTQVIAQDVPDRYAKVLQPFYEMYRMEVTLLGVNKSAELIKEGKKDYYERYYLQHCGPDGATVYSYEKLTYRNIYPNIDWVLHINKGQVEYDFVIHPGGKISDIQLQYGGATSLKIDENGTFTSTTPFGNVSEKAPYSFQSDGREVASRFILKDKVLGFQAADYKGTLTIDPTLVWGTYYYGDGVAGFIDYGAGIASAANSTDVFFSGTIECVTNIATTGAYQVNYAGAGDAFLTKFNSSGERLWGTYFGGALSEAQYSSIVGDTLGNVYLAGGTNSDSNIATPGSFKEQFPGKKIWPPNYLAKFDSSGRRLWATYYGGGKGEWEPSLATDGYNVYLASTTVSDTGIATPGSHQNAVNGGGNHAYLVKFNGAGVRLWATYYGATSTSAYALNSVACDKNGNVYMTGFTNGASNIATPGSHQSTYGGGAYDAFLVKFNSSGKRLWGTCYGGEDWDMGLSVVCDDSCNIYMVGETKSASGMATANSHQADFQGDQDIFLVKFDSSGKRQWSTYYGGKNWEGFSNVVCNGTDKVFLVGSTNSDTGIATKGAWQSVYGGANIAIYGDIFLTEFNASGVRQWGTYYGGPDIECVNFALYDKNGYLYLNGFSASDTGIATADSHQKDYPTNWSVNFFSLYTAPIFAKFCVTADGFTAASVINGKDSICRNSNTSYTIPSVAEAELYIWTLPSGWSGSSDSNSINVTSGTTGGIISVEVVRCGDTSRARIYNVYVLPDDSPLITVNGFVLGTSHPCESYQWLLNGVPVAGATKETYALTENGAYRVVTTNRWGCTDTSEVYTVNNYTGIADRNALATYIHIYPNPANSRVYIQSPVPVNVVLRTIEGRELLSQSKARSVDLTKLSAGVYMLSIWNEEGILLKTERLLKMVN